MPKNKPARVGNIIPDLKRLSFPVERLRPLPGNPRRGDVESVARSYSRFGQRKPIVARREGEDATVIAGNHQLAAAKELGWTHLAVVWVDDDEVTAKAFALADNRTSDLGTYDDSDLLAMLQSIERDEPELLAAASYSEDDLAALMLSLDAPEGAGTDTDPIEPPAEPLTQPGELILLGEHRLLCGDATSATNAEVLMDGGRGEIMWTDPPYGVSYVGKTKDALRIANDGHEGLEALLRDAFAVADSVLAPGAAMYVAQPAGQLSVTFGRAFLETGWRLHQTLVWVKDSMVLGHSDYHYRHEPILFGYTQGGGKRGRGAEGAGMGKCLGKSLDVIGRGVLGAHRARRPERSLDGGTVPAALGLANTTATVGPRGMRWRA
jgi:Predicted transcriptional regulators